MFVDPPETEETTEEELAPAGLVAGDEFGRSIAIDGDLAVVGAAGRQNARGELYVYERANGVWTERAVIAGVVDGERMGESVAITGDFILGGGSGSAQGTVRVFRRDPVSTSWTALQQLAATDAENGDNAFIVTAQGHIVLLSAIDKVEGGADAGGAVYVFEYDSASEQWPQRQKLTPEARQGGDRFGIFPSIEASTETLAIGADESRAGGAGAAYIFERDGADFRQTARLSVAGAPNGSRFGFRSRLRNRRLISGIQFE